LPGLCLSSVPALATMHGVTAGCFVPSNPAMAATGMCAVLAGLGHQLPLEAQR